MGNKPNSRCANILALVVIFLLGACDLAPSGEPVPGGSPPPPRGGAVSPPKAWTCAPESYAANDGCDCACGAPDPDCLAPRTSGGPAVRGCPSSSPYCSRDGQCVAACLSGFVSECNVYKQGDETVFLAHNCRPEGGMKAEECDSGDICLYRGFAGGEEAKCAAPPVPGWTCWERDYNDGSKCHCECGALDPDCPNAFAKVVTCEDDPDRCAEDPSCEVCGVDGHCQAR